MKVVSMIILIVLFLLAVSSGITKIMLMQQEVDFFGQYGFSDPILMGFGLIQLVGGLLLVLKRTRFVGAAIVATTFLISLVVILMEGNVPVGIATVIAITLSIILMKQSRQPAARA